MKVPPDALLMVPLKGWAPALIPVRSVLVVLPTSGVTVRVPDRIVVMTFVA